MRSTSTLAAVPTPAPAAASPTELDVLRAIIRPDFLLEAGWDPSSGVLSPPRDHPLLGLRECVVAGCIGGARRSSTDLCEGCQRRFKNFDGELERFCQIPPKRRNVGERLCVVPGCERPNHVRDGLCYAHYHHRRKQPQLTVEQWITADRVRGLPTFGDCRVASCIRRAATRAGLCHPHGMRWRQHRHDEPNAELHAWMQNAEPVGLDHIVVLKGLPEQVIVEILLALQQRTDAQVRTFVTVLRSVLTLARRHRVQSLTELLAVRMDRRRHDVVAMIRGMTTAVRRAASSPELEQTRDVWDLEVFGLRGRLDFTQISQPWLRAAAQHWAMEDLPLHRGRQASATARQTLNALARLSESLRASREDRGEHPDALSRQDIIGFTNRLAHQERSEQITAHTRLATCRRVRRFLDDVRALGLGRPGQPLAHLSVDFAMRGSDIPRESADEAPSHDLPATVLRTITAELARLETRSGLSERRITELLIDTGRRPDEVCQLPWDCLQRDAAGNPVLIYTDFKNNRPGRRLPIPEETARVITAQKDRVRAAFPDTALDELVLFPRDNTNRDGTKPMGQDTYGGAHRQFVNQIAELLVDADGQPFDPAAVFPYAYRHSYAQRHADQGVPPDVLRDLMGHRSMQTTMGYYRVTETRVRSAVDRVARHQIDSHGRRVFHTVSQLLSDQHARVRVGQIAVPFGLCTEPSNVKAAGQACPYKFTCLGCGHFRSDPSYLPELKSYLQQLLADRDYVRASTELDDWARDKAMPADEEITQLRGLIRRIEDDLEELSPGDRDLIREAVSTLRKTRQTVSIGMPSIRSTTGTAPTSGHEPPV